LFYHLNRVTSYNMTLFDGPEEEVRALEWMLEILSEKKKSLPSKKTPQLEEIVLLSAEIRLRISHIKAGEHEENWEFHDRLWSRFIFCVSNIWLDEADENWNPPYSIGEWEFDEQTEIDIGHSDYLLKTIIPKGGGSGKHEYSQPPDEIEWDLKPIYQKNMKFYIGKAKVSEIDAVCSVPQLPAELDAAESALRVLNKERGNKEWQRRVDKKRVISIRKFIAGKNNIIANSAILYGSDNQAVKIEDDGDNGTVKINFNQFLSNKKEGIWSDHNGKKDLRPIWLIDGQHRTRGIAQSEEGINLEIPIIFFPPSFSLNDAAKIFSEINTLQTKLTNLHTLFMQHRFGIPSPTAKRDFRLPWNDNSPNSRNSRANHLSYECAAYLTSNEDSALYNRIRILDQNSNQFTIIQAHQWLDFSRTWFKEGGPYAPGCSESQKIINEEVNNYFKAFIETCNHSGWEDGRDRWCKKASPKGLMQRHGPSQVLLRVFPIVHRKARRLSDNEIIGVNEFKSVLEPLTWIDWLDRRMKQYFGGSGEPGRQTLKIWIETAIREGNTYSHDEVMSEKINSVPGKGLLSPPGKSKIIDIDKIGWPNQKKSIVLHAIQPANTRATSSWIVVDSNGVNRTGDNQEILAKHGKAIRTISYQSWMNDIEYLDVRVDWVNTISPPGGAELRLTKI